MTLRGGDVGRLIATWFASTIALMLTSAVMSGLQADSAWQYVFVALISGIAGFFLRPLMVAVSAWAGWIAVILVALFGQAIVLGLAIEVVPGIHADSFWTIFVAAWVSAIVGTIVAWMTSAGTDDSLAMSLLRKRANSGPIDDPDVPGVIFVQMDGVPFPVLRWAVQAGNVPTIRSWLGSGRYALREWIPQMPCTTPASQLGILHGTVDRVPAFRWYDREVERLLVANRPADAAIIESRATNGRGLLADDGVSVSNLFTGDAARSAMVMSKLEVSRGSGPTRRAVAWFLARPDGLARSITRTIAEIVKERFQAARQERRQLDPRTHRGWDFAILRAITNGALRDLNTAVVADEMLRGTKVVYVDYVDYDEIAHHAGMFRPESLAALDGVDRVLASLEAVAEKAPRKYHIVVVSDHGQSQGTPFAARVGYDLATLCERLTEQDVDSLDTDVEGWGRAGAMMDDVGGGKGAAAGIAKRAGRSVKERVEEDVDNASGEGADLTVCGSGNLGLIYQHGPERMTLEQIEARWPRLVTGLVEHEGVGFVAAIDDAGDAIVIGPSGRRNMSKGTIEGDDPLASFEDTAEIVLPRAILMPEAPDLYVNSDVNPNTLDVSAFEPLVGCHGGLGGWQDTATFLCPVELMEQQHLDGEPIIGADKLHDVLVSILERLGHRRALADAAAAEPTA